ncbi:MAG: hypothetical protein U0T69_03700 [Chitinophagales bacterium]
MKYLLIYFGFTCLSSFGQDTLSVKKLNTQSFLLVKTDKIKQDSTSFKTPKHKQGIFCDFEDKLNRKKVPIDFSLGNSKY